MVASDFRGVMYFPCTKNPPVDVRVEGFVNFLGERKRDREAEHSALARYVLSTSA